MVRTSTPLPCVNQTLTLVFLSYTVPSIKLQALASLLRLPTYLSLPSTRISRFSLPFNFHPPPHNPNKSNDTPSITHKTSHAYRLAIQALIIHHSASFSSDTC